MQHKSKSKPAARNQAHVTMARGQEKTVTAPAVISKVLQSDFEISKGPMRGSVRIHGSDWLGRLPIPAGATAGLALGEFYINPLEYPGTRLALFAQLYDKFRFKKLTFKYVPYQGTAVPGSVVMAYDRDISDATPPANDVGVRQYMAMMDAVAGPIWQPLTMTCPLSHPEEGLFTNAVPGGDERLAYQGQVYVALLEPPNSGIILAGDLFVEYDLELFEPQLETNVSIGHASLQGPNLVSFGPAVNDLLYSFLNGAGNQTKSTAYVPKLDSLGKAYLDLAQGVYRITQSVSQSQAGGVNLGAASTVVPNTPKPAPAPQPQTGLTAAFVTSNVGSVAQKTGLYSVPPGGGRLYSTAVDVSGVDNTLIGNYQQLRVEKVADAWADLLNFV